MISQLVCWWYCFTVQHRNVWHKDVKHARVMEFIFGAPVIKNEREWIFFSIPFVKRTLSCCSAECDSFHFEFKIAPHAEPFLKAVYGKQLRQSTFAAGVEWTQHRPADFHTWPRTEGRDPHPLPRRPSGGTFASGPGTRQPLDASKSDIAVIWWARARAVRLVCVICSQRAFKQ